MTQTAQHTPGPWSYNQDEGGYQGCNQHPKPPAAGTAAKTVLYWILPPTTPPMTMRRGSSSSMSLLRVAGEAVDDDVPALVGVVNVVTAGDVEVDVVAVVAGKLTVPPVVRLVPATPAVVAAVCAAAGPASAIRRGTAMRNSRAMALSNSYLTNCYEAPAPIIPADASARCGLS